MTEHCGAAEHSRCARRLVDQANKVPRVKCSSFAGLASAELHQTLRTPLGAGDSSKRSAACTSATGATGEPGNRRLRDPGRTAPEIWQGHPRGAWLQRRLIRCDLKTQKRSYRVELVPSCFLCLWACLASGAYAFVPSVQTRLTGAPTFFQGRRVCTGRPAQLLGGELRSTLCHRSTLVLEMCAAPEDKGTAPDWSTAPRSSGINTPSTKIGESVRGETEDAIGEDDSGEEEAPARTNAKDGQPGSNSNANHRLNNAFTGGWVADAMKQNTLLNRWFEEEIHEMETSVGYDIPGQGQIVEYDPAFLSKFGWFINLRGSVFSIPFIYWQFLGLLCFALLYAWAAGPMPAVIDVMGMQGVACSSGGRLRLPILKPQTFALTLVGGLLGFLLSLFNSNGLDRWWKTRDCLGIVIGRSVDIARMFATYVQGWDAESEKRAQWYRKQLIRWLNLAHILVYRQAQNQDDIEDLVEDSTYSPARQWLTREELVLFEPSLAERGVESISGISDDSLSRRRRFFAQQLAARPRTAQSRKQETKVHDPPLISRYVMVYFWMDELLSKASREGLIDPSRPEALWKMQDSITKMRGAAADVFMYLYCKIPYVYVHLMTLLVKVYLLVIAAVGGSCIKIAWMAGRPTDLFLAVGMIFFINLTYEGLMHIHIRVWNPLGLDRNDFPQRRYMDFVWAATHQFLYPSARLKPSFMVPEGGLSASRPPPSGYPGAQAAYIGNAFPSTPNPYAAFPQGPLVPPPIPYQAPGFFKTVIPRPRQGAAVAASEFGASTTANRPKEPRPVSAAAAEGGVGAGGAEGAGSSFPPPQPTPADLPRVPGTQVVMAPQRQEGPAAQRASQPSPAGGVEGVQPGVQKSWAQIKADAVAQRDKQRAAALDAQQQPSASAQPAQLPPKAPQAASFARNVTRIPGTQVAGEIGSREVPLKARRGAASPQQGSSPRKWIKPTLRSRIRQRETDRLDKPGVASEASASAPSSQSSGADARADKAAVQSFDAILDKAETPAPAKAREDAEGAGGADEGQVDPLEDSALISDASAASAASSVVQGVTQGMTGSSAGAEVRPSPAAASPPSAAAPSVGSGGAGDAEAKAQGGQGTTE